METYIDDVFDCEGHWKWTLGCNIRQLYCSFWTDNEYKWKIFKIVKRCELTIIVQVNTLILISQVKCQERG